MPPPSPVAETRPSTPTPSPAAHHTPSNDPSRLNPRENNTVTRFNEWAVKNSIAVTGWLVAFASMIVAIVSLLPGFRGQRLSEKALELAEWTALKDYIEQCKQILEAGVASSECEQASTMSLPPPPHVKTHSIDHIKRLISLGTNNTSVESFDFDKSSDLTPVMIMLAVFLTLLLIAVFLFASFENRKSLYLQNRVYWQNSESVTFTMDLALQERPESTSGALTTIDTEPFRPVIEFDSHEVVIFQSLYSIRPFNGWSAEETRLADYKKGFRYGIQQGNTCLPAAQLNEPRSPDGNPQTLKTKDNFLLNPNAQSSGIDSLHADNLLQRKRARAASDTQQPEHIALGGEGEDVPGENKERRSLACPYYKRNLSKYFDCIFIEQKAARYVKVHLQRRHREPIHCPPCFQIFGDRKDRDDHVLDAGCKPLSQAENPFIDLIDDGQWESLSRRPRFFTDVENWKHMYSIVFPGHPPPSPFRDGRAEAKLVVESYRNQMAINESNKMDVDISAGRARGQSRFLTEIDVENILAEMLQEQ